MHPLKLAIISYLITIIFAFGISILLQIMAVTVKKLGLDQGEVEEVVVEPEPVQADLGPVAAVIAAAHAWEKSNKN
jgi:hypothetical protein